MMGSTNEIAALAAKAARGAGAPPAQATQFGQATTCHLAAERDPALLDQALDSLPLGPITTLPGALMRLLEGATGDTAQGMLPATGLTQSYAEAQPFALTCAQTEQGFDITFALNSPANRPMPARLTLPAPLADKMMALAARTYVPETEASRLSGAGAGLTDND